MVVFHNSIYILSFFNVKKKKKKKIKKKKKKKKKFKL